MPDTQKLLNEQQIEAFYVDCFASDQVRHFEQLTQTLEIDRTKFVVDVGGGVGYFARELHDKTRLKVRVLDTDRTPDGRSNSPTFGHFKIPHPDECVRAR